jgi:hypothetical protein
MTIKYVHTSETCGNLTLGKENASTAKTTTTKKASLCRTSTEGEG